MLVEDKVANTSLSVVSLIFAYPIVVYHLMLCHLLIEICNYLLLSCCNDDNVIALFTTLCINNRLILLLQQLLLTVLYHEVKVEANCIPTPQESLCQNSN